MPNTLSIDPPFELLIFQWLGIVLGIRFWQTGNAKPAVAFKAEGRSRPEPINARPMIGVFQARVSGSQEII